LSHGSARKEHPLCGNYRTLPAEREILKGTSHYRRTGDKAGTSDEKPMGGGEVLPAA
jgi:hypothetical protein